MKHPVVIIGAGPAGLTAAYELLRTTNAQVLVLESSQHIGGISRTETHHGNRIDLGGHRFFSKNQEVNQLWRERLPHDDPETQERVFLKRPRRSRIFYLKHFFSYPISFSVQTVRNLGLVRTMRAGVSYLASVAHKREERSLEDFYINRFGKALYRMFFEDYTEKLWGVHPSSIAPDWGAQRVKGLSLWKLLTEPLKKRLFPGRTSTETSLIEEFLYPKRGPGQLWEAFAEEIQKLGGEIRFGAEVTGLSHSYLDGRISELTVNHTEQISTEAVFSSMPIKDLVAALGSSALESVQRVARSLPYRDFLTVGLLLKPSSKLKELTDTWIYIQEREVTVGRLQLFHHWSPYLLADPETLWVGLEYFCTEGDALWTRSEPEMIAFAVQELSSIGLIEPEDVLDSVRIRVPKAYPAYFGAYEQFPVVRKFLDGIENLYCIGRNGQHRYNNMDHSMLTALEAVRAYAGTGTKERVWAVNTEEAYHEAEET